MKNLKLSFFSILIIVPFLLSAQKFQGLAPTPPMGWNSWNTFQTNINEDLVKQTADLFVSTGMKDAGYTYIVLDDGWMTMQRDSVTGNLVADPKKFPHGMKALAAYVHSKGLKFGLYNCAGTKTCAGYPGTKDHEAQDAKLYASWDIDYLKFDWCYADGMDAPKSYAKMSQALHDAGRPIIFSLCEWGSHDPWLWAAPVGQLWRTTGDIGPVFETDTDTTHGWRPNGVMAIVDMQDTLYKYSGPDHWNDPDMLEVGNGMKPAEDRTHFSMWCMFAAPLMAGNDIRKMSKETLSILTNKDAIAIDQDVAGMQAFRYSDKDSVQVWFRPLKNGDWAVCFINRSAQPKQISFDWKKENVQNDFYKKGLHADAIAYKLFDVWTKKNIGTTSKALTATVQPHDVLMLRMQK